MSTFGDDNPFSIQDESMRAKAQERMSYWRNQKETGTNIYRQISIDTQIFNNLNGSPKSAKTAGSVRPYRMTGEESG